MEKNAASQSASSSVDTNRDLFRRFKEKLAQRLWALSSLTETEKEIVFKEYLSDLDELEKAWESEQQVQSGRAHTFSEENELLRSLLGVPGDDLKVRILELTNELTSIRKKDEAAVKELDELNQSLVDIKDENDILRKRIRELESGADHFRLQQLKLRDEDIQFFSESHEVLKNQMKDMEGRLSNMRHLFAVSSDHFLKEKQDEIAVLQKRLLEEMEETLKKKQQLSWNEEEMFAKGVAHRVRTALVSAQGQLMLTLERLGILDPGNQNESFWKARVRLLMEGGEELSRNFKSIQTLLQEVTGTLDDYLHLTHRRDIVHEPLSLKELVQTEMAEIYKNRLPTLSVEFLSDDPLPLISGDLSLLRFVVKELFKNALESMPDQKGQIVISLKNQSSRGYIQLNIRDTGSGIPSHLQSRLFQPFFTTKEHRQGLSLSRARRYAEFHGGELKLVHTSPQGTTFELNLPLEGPGT